MEIPMMRDILAHYLQQGTCDDVQLGIMTGTFDPMHETHIEIAENTLKKNFGPAGNDVVFNYSKNYETDYDSLQIKLVLQHHI